MDYADGQCVWGGHWPEPCHGQPCNESDSLGASKHVIAQWDTLVTVQECTKWVIVLPNQWHGVITYVHINLARMALSQQ